MKYIGDTLTNIGVLFLPISFIAYFIGGLLTYIWHIRYKTKLIKAIWYILNAILIITNDINVEYVAIMILFFEAYDAVMDYFEEKRSGKLDNVQNKK